MFPLFWKTLFSLIPKRDARAVNDELAVVNLNWLNMVCRRTPHQVHIIRVKELPAKPLPVFPDRPAGAIHPIPVGTPMKKHDNVVDIWGKPIGAVGKGSGQEGGQIFYLKMTSTNLQNNFAHVCWPPWVSPDHF